VHRDQIVLPEEEVDVARGEGACPLLAVYPVQHEIEILGILLDLGVLERAARIFNGKRMEMKDIVQQGKVAVGGLRQIHPELDR